MNSAERPRDSDGEGHQSVAYLSLGSNIDPEEHLERTYRWLEEQWGIEASSHVYRTTPLEMEPGADPVWNLAVAIRVSEPPARLKARLQSWEDRLDRDRSGDSDSLYASRKLDADILFYDPLPPHGEPDREVFERSYVAVPLSELIEVPPGWDRGRQAWLQSVGDEQIEEQLFHPRDRWS